jgi:hypothetical protein
MRHLVRRLTIGTAAFVAVLGAAAPAHATLTGFQNSNTGWVDFNGDGKADHCKVNGNNTLRCDVSSGRGVLYTSTVGNADPGYSHGAGWVDFNGDRMADYCRVIGSGYTMLQCTIGVSGNFGTTFTSGAVDAGYDAGRAWVDFDGDGKADYCRVVGSGDKRVSCTLSAGTGYGSTFTSDALDPGWDAGRAWVDANRDGRADYCRIVGNAAKFAQCTLSTGSGFGATISSGAIDPGYDNTRQWTDVDNDGIADYCRYTGSAFYSSATVQCTTSRGIGFASSSFTVGPLDGGYASTIAWADMNADGRADLCRSVDPNIERCTLSTGTGLGGNIEHPMPSSGGQPVWADVDGDGDLDHCTTFSAVNGYECWPSNRTSFGTPWTQPF